MARKVKFVAEEEAGTTRKRQQREHAVARAEHFALAESSSGDATAAKASSSSGSSARQSTPSGMIHHAASSKFDNDRGIQGPFSIASQILASADKVREERENITLLSVKDGKDLTVEQQALLDSYDRILFSILQNPTKKESSTRANTRALTGPIDSLASLAVKSVVGVFDRVGDLHGVCSKGRIMIAEELAKARRLNERSALLLSCIGSDSLCLPECSILDDRTILQAIAQIAGSSATAEQLAWLKPCPLRVINLKNCGHALSDKTAGALAAHTTALEILCLTGCYKLTDKGLTNLLQPIIEAGPSSILRELDLSTNSRLGTSGLSALSRLQCLQSLSISGCGQLNDLNMSPFMEDNAFPFLKHLALEGLVNITEDTSIPLLKRHGAELQTLNLSGCSKLTQGTLAQIRESCSQLVSLDISYMVDIPTEALLGLFLCSEVQDDEQRETSRVRAKLAGTSISPEESLIPTTTSTSVGPLQSLNLRSLEGMTDHVCRHIAVGMGANLEMFNMAGCHKMGNRSAILLASHCTSLKYIDLSFCRGIQNEVLKYLVSSVPKLQTLHVWGCTQLNDSFFSGHSNFDLLCVGSNRNFN